MRFFRFLLVSTTVLFLLGVISAGTATYIYYRQVREEVQQAFATYRWDVPSRIYSDRQPLFPGLSLEKQQIVAKLNRMGYRQVEQVERPGEYSKTADSLDLYQRATEHPTFGHPARRIRFVHHQDIILRIELPDLNESTPLVFFEPETLAVLVGEHWQNRELVPLSEMPAAMTQAVVAIEDRRFYTHQGIDPIGIARAIVKDVLAMRLAEGGSTLTQQLVKNIILRDPSRKFSRKYKELVMAYVIDREYSKEEILEKYLNEIYFGQDGPYEVRGIGAAARHYFGKPVDELTIAECAALAGIIHGPNRYSQGGRFRLEPMTARRNQVLNAMYQVGYLTREELTPLSLEPPKTRTNRPPRRLAPYFVDLLQRKLKEEYTADGLSEEGLSVYTTLQPHIQEAAEKAVTKQLTELEARYSRLRRSDPEQQLQAAVVVLRPATGEILALVGGRNYDTTSYNRIFSALRQPGSLVKPFVYLSALESATTSTSFPGGFHPLSPLDDTATTFKYKGVEYKPANYDKQVRGQVPAYFALSRSLNIPAVAVLRSAGPEQVAKTFRAFGVTTPFQDLLPSALGVSEVYPIEIARAFGALAAGGTLAESRLLSSVVGPNGRLLDHISFTTREAADSADVAVLNGMLQEVVNNGTARAVRRAGLDLPVAGKTGTTDNGRDAWFVGYTPDLLALVWVGFDNGTPLGLTGSSAALPIWIDTMAALDLAQDPFPLPDGTIEIDVATDRPITEARCESSRTIRLVVRADRMPVPCPPPNETIEF